MEDILFENDFVFSQNTYALGLLYLPIYPVSGYNLHAFLSDLLFSIYVIYLLCKCMYLIMYI